MLTGDHLDAVSADHSVRLFRPAVWARKITFKTQTLSNEKFGGPNILSAVKTPRDLQIASIGKGHCAHGQAHG